MFWKIPLLNDLSDVEKKSLEDFVQERRLSENEILFREWELANSLYFLTDWKLEVTKSWKVLWYIEPGDVVWEMSVFDNDNIRTATVTSISDSRLLVILGFSIKEISASNPVLHDKLKHIILERKNKNNS